MQRQLTDAWGTRHALRVARKAGKCSYWFGTRSCGKAINIGDIYVEGELDDTSLNPFVMERWCLGHDDYFPALAKATGGAA